MPNLNLLSAGSALLFFIAADAQNAGHAIIDTSARPEVFAPGVVSSPFEEVAATFMPDGNTVYFAQGTLAMEICFSKKVNGEWQKPAVAAFSGRWGDWDPFLAPDGRRIYFVSNRPLDTTGDNKLKRQPHLWYADHLDGDRWSDAQYFKESFNLDGVPNFAPSVSRAQDLFFYSPQRDKTGKAKSFYVKWQGNHYGEPQALLLNGDAEVGDPYIAPDERYIIFVSDNDLYISYRVADGWGAGQKLGPQVNDGSSIYDPTVSPDGKMLFYTSNRIKDFYKRDAKSLPLNYDGLLREMNGIFNGRGNIFMIPIRI
jgi:Tol biopolymer transport system component